MKRTSWLVGLVLTIIACGRVDDGMESDPTPPPGPVATLTFEGDDVVCLLAAACNLFPAYQRDTTVTVKGIDATGRETALDPSLLRWETDGPIALTVSGSGPTVTARANHDYFTYMPRSEPVVNVKVRYGNLEEWLPTALVLNVAGRWSVDLGPNRPAVEFELEQSGRTVSAFGFSGQVDEDLISLEQGAYSLTGRFRTRTELRGSYSLPGLGAGDFTAIKK